MNRHNFNTEKPSQSRRLASVAIVAGLAVAGCTEPHQRSHVKDSVAATTTPSLATERTVPNLPAPESTAITTFINVPEIVIGQTSNDANKFAKFIQNVTASHDPYIYASSSESVDQISADAYKYVKEADGTLTRYSTTVTYGGDTAYERVDDVFIAVDKDIRSNATEMPLVGSGFFIRYTRTDDGNWTMQTNDVGEKSPMSYTTQTLRGAQVPNLETLTTPIEASLTHQADDTLRAMQLLPGVADPFTNN